MTDRWIEAHSPIEPERLHALGYMNVRWNSCELAFKAIYSFSTRKNFAESWTLSQERRYRQLCKEIRTFFTESQNTEDVKKSVLFALTLFDVNRRNRNQLTHYLFGTTKEGRVLWNSENPSYAAIFDQQPVPSDLKSIRSVCEQLDELLIYASGIVGFFSNRHLGGFFEPPPPLPDKPALPKRIWQPPQRSKARARDSQG